MTDHDALYKELLRTFFQDFMELFFPETAVFMDFTEVEFLSEEVVVDIAGGKKSRLDVLVKTRLKHEQAFILVHQEPQAYYQEEFPERMFIYAARLYEKYRLRVLPIAIISHSRQTAEPEGFGWELPGLEVLRFRYHRLQLRKLNWRNYVHSVNPVAAALLSSMGYNEEEKIRLKLEFIRMMAQLQLDPARMELLAVFFDTYLPLTKEEEQQVWREVKQIYGVGGTEVMEWKTHFERYAKEEGKEEGLREGIEKGIEQGIEKGKLQVVRHMLAERLDPALIAKVTGFSLDEINRLDQ
ncbi:Rpn family recombination-promoting nuclease/putative transposase [Paenibacillus sp. YN15]|uniref:Rpn family recombination-promoting nuclease/putative transposase n=1 Tax=Paenibacillus sp. YN15 TaxID=1742774 RepID=UPI0015EC439D|nr:Rpn family recombination-promoting nuclease/putative transposase [Paenibacillus sp. YN15]